jgi:hypothetical protein
MVEHGLSLDDFALTLRELRSQRNQLRLQLEVVDAGVVKFEDIVRGLGGDVD